MGYRINECLRIRAKPFRARFFRWLIYSASRNIPVLTYLTSWASISSAFVLQTAKHFCNFLVIFKRTLSSVSVCSYLNPKWCLLCLLLHIAVNSKHTKSENSTPRFFTIWQDTSTTVQSVCNFSSWLFKGLISTSYASSIPQCEYDECISVSMLLHVKSEISPSLIF